MQFCVREHGFLFEKYMDAWPLFSKVRGGGEEEGRSGGEEEGRSG